MPRTPTFHYELEYWRRGMRLIAGVDEVGVGALAGPVVAGTVIFKPAQIPPNPPLSRGALRPVAQKVNFDIGHIPYERRLIEPARENRKNPTEAERVMWSSVLRRPPISTYTFLRQKPLDAFIADFYCPKLLLVIEVDGDSHKGNEEYDVLRSEKLADFGIKVLRYTNERVLNDTVTVRHSVFKRVYARVKELNAPLDKGGLGGIDIRDSKQLSARQRERAAVWIRQHALAWAVGEASVAEITELNILQAAHLAMRRAVDGLKIVPQLLLVDGRAVPVHPSVPAVPIIHGDGVCYSIAAASIVAKVHRDSLMTALDAQYPGYGFAAHKGYGSAAHLAALRHLGPSPCHRPTYAPVRAALH